MNRFLHTSVRLHTDLGRATRFFTTPQQLTKWFCGSAEADTSMRQLQLENIREDLGPWIWHLEHVEREVRIDGWLSDCMNVESDRRFRLEIRLMKCTSLTEYCSEIHVMQSGFDETPEDEGLRNAYSALWQDKLDSLRRLVNGNWIIEDRDLTMDVFR